MFCQKRFGRQRKTRQVFVSDDTRSKSCCHVFSQWNWRFVIGGGFNHAPSWAVYYRRCCARTRPVQYFQLRPRFRTLNLEQCLRTAEMLMLGPKSSSLCWHYESDCTSAGYMWSGRYVPCAWVLSLCRRLTEWKVNMLKELLQLLNRVLDCKSHHGVK